MKHPLIAAALSFSALACTHLPELKPDPGTPRAPGNPDAALAEVSGVRVLVAGDAWRGEPRNLPGIFTPVQVTVENQSNRPLRVNYEQFKLVGNSGFAYAAIPPMQARGEVSESARPGPPGALLPADYARAAVVAVPVAPPIRPYYGFYVAPHVAWYYPGWTVWPYAFPYDPFYYDRMYAYWPERLPTRDMLAEALPAGALNHGARVSGFLYFQGIAQRESRVSFEMDLVDASSGQSFGHVSLPFEVRK